MSKLFENIGFYVQHWDHPEDPHHAKRRAVVQSIEEHGGIIFDHPLDVGVSKVIVSLPGPAVVGAPGANVPVRFRATDLVARDWTLEKLVGHFAASRTIDLLSDEWVLACAKAGRKIGLDEEWAGCKVIGLPPPDPRKDPRLAMLPISTGANAIRLPIVVAPRAPDPKKDTRPAASTPLATRDGNSPRITALECGTVTGEQPVLALRISTLKIGPQPLGSQPEPAPPRPKLHAPPCGHRPSWSLLSRRPVDVYRDVNPYIPLPTVSRATLPCPTQPYPTPPLSSSSTSPSPLLPSTPLLLQEPNIPSAPVVTSPPPVASPHPPPSSPSAKTGHAVTINPLIPVEEAETLSPLDQRLLRQEVFIRRKVKARRDAHPYKRQGAPARDAENPYTTTTIRNSVSTNTSPRPVCPSSRPVRRDGLPIDTPTAVTYLEVDDRQQRNTQQAEMRRETAQELPTPAPESPLTPLPESPRPPPPSLYSNRFWPSVPHADPSADTNEQDDSTGNPGDRLLTKVLLRPSAREPFDHCSERDPESDDDFPDDISTHSVQSFFSVLTENYGRGDKGGSRDEGTGQRSATASDLTEISSSPPPTLSSTSSRQPAPAPYSAQYDMPDGPMTADDSATADHAPIDYFARDEYGLTYVGHRILGCAGTDLPEGFGPIFLPWPAGALPYPGVYDEDTEMILVLGDEGEAEQQ